VNLKGGISSSFKINVDGITGPAVTDIEIEANDSIYVFVSVSLPSNASIQPFVVQDSIEISFNGNLRYIQLETWGQNANFLRSRRLTGQVTWNNTLPYVILGGIQVDTNAVLTIQPGCKIYMHADAPFIVDGTLLVKGEAFDSTRVYFQSDRLDEPYKAFPAGWPGIFFRGESVNNELNYAVIRNGYQGIVAEQYPLNANPKVVLNQCIIDNIYDAGILGFQSDIRANNCLISNCGKNIQLVYGGNYQFSHCTVASYSNDYLTHQDPVLLVSNNTKLDNVVLTADMNAVFRNCIFWGDGGAVENEVVVSKQGTRIFNVNFENSLWRVLTAPANITSSNIINNQDPVFDSINVQRRFFDFRLKESSPVLNKGVQTGLAVDLDGMPRATGLPDFGAYERP
jgi:hypothetical protein